MFEKVTISGAPTAGKYGAYYKLDDSHYAKITLVPVSQDTENATMQRVGYQVDADGNFLLDDHGKPLCTQAFTTSISVPNIQSGVATLAPGWRKAPWDQKNAAGEPITLMADTVPAGWQSGSGAPTAPGALGDYYVDLDVPQVYQYYAGELELIRQQSCQEVLNQLGTNLLF